MKVDLSAFEHAVEQEGLAVQGLQVYREEELIGNWMPEPEERRNLYSGTKSFTSTAVGFAVQEGLLSLEDRVVDRFPDDLPDHVSAGLKQMTLRNLITMSMGMEKPLLMSDTRYQLKAKNWAKFVLEQPVVHTPGSVFLYSNAAPHLLGILVQRLTGKSLGEYLKPRFFDPLHMDVPEFEKDPLGYDFGAGGMKATISEYSKLGLFYLQRGFWHGRQLLPETWIAAATSPQIPTGEGDDEVGRHYGYQFWIMPDGMYRAAGKYGQFCVVVPRKRAVVTVVSMQTENEDRILRLLLRTILPQL